MPKYKSCSNSWWIDFITTTPGCVHKKPFKDYLYCFYPDWIASGPHNLMPGGSIKKLLLNFWTCGFPKHGLRSQNHLYKKFQEDRHQQNALDNFEDHLTWDDDTISDNEETTIMTMKLWMIASRSKWGIVSNYWYKTYLDVPNLCTLIF